MAGDFSPGRKLFSGLAMMAILGFTMATLGFEIAADWALDEKGRKAYARVVKKEVASYSRRLRPRTSYIVRFRFTDNTGQRILGSDSVEKEVYDRIRLGQGLNIKYLRGYPDVHRIGEASPYLLTGGIFLVFFVLFGFAVSMVIHARR